MQENPKNNSSWFSMWPEIISMLAAVAGVILTFTFSMSNHDLEEQIAKRDVLLRLRSESDSLRAVQTAKNREIVEKYIDDCNILIDGKKVSTDQLLSFMRAQIDSSDALRDELRIAQDSLNRLNRLVSMQKEWAASTIQSFKKVTDTLAALQAFHRLAKKNLNADFTISGDTITLQSERDSLAIYRKLYSLAQEDYGISYNVKEEGKYTTYTRNMSTADSALAIFEYYRDRISLDTLNNMWNIKAPWRPFKRKK